MFQVSTTDPKISKYKLVSQCAFVIADALKFRLLKNDQKRPFFFFVLFQPKERKRLKVLPESKKS